MHRFGEQIEFRIDRRQILLLFLGGLFWTMLAFFLGMMAGGHGHVQKNLSALGWWESRSGLPRDVPPVVRPGHGSVSFRESVSQARPGRSVHVHRQTPPPQQRLRSAIGTPRRAAVDHVRPRRPSGRQRRTRPAQRVRVRVQRQRRRRNQQPSLRVRPRPPRRRPSRTRLVRRVEPPVDRLARSSTSSVLADAQRFMRAKESRLRTSQRRASRACQILVPRHLGRYVIWLGAPTSLRGMRRLRLRLRKSGYAARIIRRQKRFRLELGRFARYSDAARCLRQFRRTHTTSARITRIR